MDARSLILTFFITSTTFAISQPQVFNAENSHCYELKIENTSLNRNEGPTFDKQVWCYHHGDSKKDPLFIYNADQAQIRPELSLIVDSEGFITHASLLAGVLTYHKILASEFNPFSIPLEEPQNLPLIKHPQIQAESANQNLNKLLRYEGEGIRNLTALDQSTLSASAYKLPWRGFWWGYKNQPLSNGPLSPLGKYDQYARTHGFTSNATTWENSNHRYRGIWWEGHCNGWAASSILRAEPRVSRFDSVSGVTFSVADLKGILAETDYCSTASFFGSRNRGRSTDDSRDIYAPLFHKTVLYYIGILHKPVVMDYRSDTPVDNNPVSAYSMNIVQLSPTSLDVTATLTFHKYDGKRSFPPGIAPAYTRVYHYVLNLKDDGSVSGGYWKSNNPDFIWVPLSPATCKSNNPNMKLDLVSQIISLPVTAGEEAFSDIVSF